MRPKSIEKFKAKVRDLTPRRHNLDQLVITNLNRVIPGTADYFATTLSRGSDLFRGLDRWIRMRLRCMKDKRKSYANSGRLRLRHLRQRGLLFLSELRPLPVQATAWLPPKGALAMGSPRARKGHAGK